MDIDASEQDAPEPTAPLADWDMSSYFPSIDSSEYREFCAQLASDIDLLSCALREALPLSASSIDAWLTMLGTLENLSARTNHLVSYLDCLGSADARDATIKKESAALSTTTANLDKLYVWVRSALGACDSEVFSLLIQNPRARSAEHFIARLRSQSQKSMDPALEGLSADLGVNGISAWGRLYDQVTGTLEFEMHTPGHEPQSLPVSMTRSLLEDADPTVRKAAFDGSAKAWKGASEVLAAALNAISGTRLALCQRRGMEHFLEPALFDASISRKTLNCMLDTVRARQSLPQDYLRHKAKMLGMESLRFCDLMAPLGNDESGRASWEEGAEQVQSAFDASYPALGDMTRRAFDERWIDYSPRSGKRPGGFCSTSPLAKESRIFMTFNGGMGDVQTLAHELGHTFHSYLMRDMRPWAADYPMTLAETASTFAENIVTSAALQSPETTHAQKLALLDQRLQDSSAFLLNIPMRFDFECALYEARASGELSVAALKEMMLVAQRKNYGSSVDPEQLDPWFWASKLHFFITEVSFYNFPYTFGYLFSLGIFARFAQEGPSFLPHYEKLLQSTGSASAEEVAMNAIGVNLEEPEFWNASIDLIESDWRTFQDLSDP